MKRKGRKILIWIITILIVLAGIFYLILPLIFENILSNEPRDPKLEITETNKIGWWSYQESLTIETFNVKIIESNLNLFNSKSLIKYNVKGKLSYKNNWKPSIKNIHISQRFLKRETKKSNFYILSDTINIPEAIIEITPIIEVKEDNNYKGEVIEFEFTNELKLESFHWGKNCVRFECGNKIQDLILKQKK